MRLHCSCNEKTQVLAAMHHHNTSSKEHCKILVSILLFIQSTRDIFVYKQ